MARAKVTFDGSIERLSCVTQHEDYEALTNRTVLLQVAPLLRDKNGRSYRRRTGVTENECVLLDCDCGFFFIFELKTSNALHFVSIYKHC